MNHQAKNHASISPAEVEKYLKGSQFPLDKGDIIMKAKQNHAPNEVLQFLNSIQNKKYASATEIAQQVGH